MRELVTRGIICLKDDAGIEYQISKIEYRLWENEEFEYRFRPDYAVISLLDDSLFQGIPGLDLDAKKEEYVRRNIVPTFISERSPGKNRENLWELLESHGMEYLNQLEWLIRTDTKYIGDRLYVIEDTVPAAGPINIDEEMKKCKRAVDSTRRLLEYICRGMDIVYGGFMIDDQNRKSCYELLYRMYQKERRFVLQRQKQGIEQAKQDGKYRGRKPLQIDTPRLYEVYRNYKSKQITADEAAETLGVSKATFFRRIKNLNTRSGPSD